jgi:hypothetical protein
MVLAASFVLSLMIGFLATIAGGSFRRLNAGVEASTARFPKFVRHPRPHLHELRKAKGSS